MKAQLVELNKSAGAGSLNFNRFSTAKKHKPLTKAELKKLTPQERFAYNINN